jgi:hypothetical protein
MDESIELIYMLDLQRVDDEGGLSTLQLKVLFLLEIFGVAVNFVVRKDLILV